MTDEAPDAAVADAPGPLSEADAAALVRSLSPASIFGVLKDIEYVLALKRVFAGFQAKSEGLKNPLAQRRLVIELINNNKLAAALQDLTRGCAATPHSSKPESPRPQPKPNLPAAPKPPRDEELTRERDRLKQQLREAQCAAREQQAAATNLQRELVALQNQLAAARQEIAAEQAHRSSQDRRLHRLERELAEARTLARRIDTAQPNSQSAAIARTQRASASASGLSGAAGDPGAAVAALERLLSRHKLDTVGLVVDEMLRADPADLAAHRVRALLRIAQGDKSAALDDLRLVFAAQLRVGDAAAAARTLLQTGSVAGSLDAKMAAELFATLARHQTWIGDVAAALAPLAGTSGYDALRALCKPPLTDRLFAAAGSDAGPLTLPPVIRQALGPQVSARALVEAIDTGNTALVETARSAILRSDKATRDQLEQLLAEIADLSYFRLLTRREPQGPAVVDASNVAHYEREMMATDRPRLASLMAVLAALRERGYFPLTVIADANLPYLLDRSAEFRQMVQQGKAQLVTSGTVADEVILREARRLGAVVVSNDYMADWDPQGQVDKVQFSISMTDGRATLYE